MLAHVHTRFSRLDAHRGTTKESRGTAYIAYEDIYDAKTACDHLSGFNVANRYLIVLYYNPQRINKKVSTFNVCGHCQNATCWSCKKRKALFEALRKRKGLGAY
jgi:RNA recognition motif-containing protein